MKRLFNRTLLLLTLALASLVAPLSARATDMSDYLENKLIDHVFRGQAYTAPSTIYFALFTSSCSDSAGGTEVTGGSYARASLAASLANWAGTQSAGSTVASSGTSGTTSNNGVVTFATPSAGWGTVTHLGIYDAVSSGNLLICRALTVSKTINSGDTVTFPAASFTFQIDN
ncbi:MAG TPA: hypothetical protein DDX06_04425 [Curvibacter sp.]|nr:hypothetical protein [Curvibacter sp.]